MHYIIIALFLKYRITIIYFCSETRTKTYIGITVQNLQDNSIIEDLWDKLNFREAISSKNIHLLYKYTSGYAP